MKYNPFPEIVLIVIAVIMIATTRIPAETHEEYHEEITAEQLWIAEKEEPVINWNYFYEPKQMNSTYMGVHCITLEGSDQKNWLDSHDWYYSDEDIVEYEGRTLVALTMTFGNVGDYIDLLFDDGSIMNCIIGDIKWNCEKYGHRIGEYLNVIEIIVSESWYEEDKDNKVYPTVTAWRRY